MKYTIGCHVLNKDGSTADGIYVFGKYGFPYISNDVSTFPEKECSIYIIDDAENTQKYIQYLSRLYRCEFKSRAKKLAAPVQEFRFYPIKLTDKRFDGYTFEKDTKWRANKKENAKYQFLGDASTVSIYYVKA